MRTRQKGTNRVNNKDRANSRGSKVAVNKANSKMVNSKARINREVNNKVRAGKVRASKVRASKVRVSKVRANNKANKVGNSKVVELKTVDNSMVTVSEWVLIQMDKSAAIVGATTVNCRQKFVSVFAKHRIYVGNGVAQLPAPCANSMK